MRIVISPELVAVSKRVFRDDALKSMVPKSSWAGENTGPVRAGAWRMGTCGTAGVGVAVTTTPDCLTVDRGVGVAAGVGWAVATDCLAEETGVGVAVTTAPDCLTVDRGVGVGFGVGVAIATDCLAGATGVGVAVTTAPDCLTVESGVGVAFGVGVAIATDCLAAETGVGVGVGRAATPPRAVACGLAATADKIIRATKIEQFILIPNLPSLTVLEPTS